MMLPLRVAMVMPPVVTGDPGAAVARWPTVTRTLAAMRTAGEVDVQVFGRHRDRDAVWSCDNDTYSFSATDQLLAAAVASARPDVVHVHGLSAVRLLLRLHRALPATVPIVVQHHGEPVPGRRGRWAHRLVRRHLAGYLFTGAAGGQAQPFIDAGMISPRARLFDVLESASLLHDGAEHEPRSLAGNPSILWVGRLIESKDPLCAIDAFHACAPRLPHAQLHLLATDRTLEPMVRARIAALGPAAAAVHVHDPVAHTDMASWYAAADVYLSTSRREGSNYSLIEALSCGCAPAVSDIPPHRAIVGSLAAPFGVGDAHAAAEAIVAASTLPRAAASAHSQQHLGWPAVARQLRDVYSTLAYARVVNIA